MSTLSENEPPVCLFSENSNGLVSWWDVERFSALFLHEAMRLLDGLDSIWQSQTAEVDADKIGTIFKTSEALLKRSGLATSAEAVVELHSEVAENSTTAADMSARVKEIRRTIRRESKTIQCLYIPATAVQFYREPLKDWEEVVERWPAVKDDIEESSKCFALERYAASLFHALLVAEFGVIQVCNLFAKSGDKPGWGCVDRLEQIQATPFGDRSKIEQQYSGLLKNTLHEMHVLKADRHILTHIDNKGDWLMREIGPNNAKSAIAAARKFMLRIAKDLPKSP